MYTSCENHGQAEASSAVFSRCIRNVLCSGFSSFVFACCARKLALNEITANTVVRRTGRRYTLHYLCKASALYSFDIDSHHVSRSLAAVDSALKNELQQDHAVDASVVAAFLGGGAGAWSIKDLVQAVSSAQPKDRLLAVVVGAVSGYAIGFDVGKRLGSSCDMPEVHAKLSDVGTWNRIAKARYALELLRRVKSYDQREIFTMYALNPFRDQIASVFNKVQDDFGTFEVGSSDFWALDVTTRRMELATLLAKAEQDFNSRAEMGRYSMPSAIAKPARESKVAAFYRAELQKSEDVLMAGPTPAPPREQFEVLTVTPIRALDETSRN